jgi:hypothetical protein
MIALKWADVTAGNRNPTKLKHVSPEFREAIGELGVAMEGIENVETKWQPRLKSVQTFGH